MKRTLAVIAAAALALALGAAFLSGCGGTEGDAGGDSGPPPELVLPPEAGPGWNSPEGAPTFAPGSVVNLDALLPRVGWRELMPRPLRTALALIGSPPGGYTWRFDPAFGTGAGEAAGMSLTGSLLRTPDCRLTNPPGWPFPIRVQAVQDSVVKFSITITADERFIESKIACYIPSGESVCRDPATGITVEAGSSVQFYSLVKATCTQAYEPPLPAGACPASDPAFAFCR